MLSVGFMKAPPTTYVLHFQNGRVRREGAGLSFFYWAPGATIVAVPLGSADAPFAFQEATADFQAVAIQGQVTYRVAEPRRLAALLDLSVAPNGRYRTDDYQKLPERLVHATQMLMRAETQRLALAEALTPSPGLRAPGPCGLETALAPVRGLDWRMLMALRGGDSAATIALAFQELAASAGRIGELNISPDLLRALLPAAARGRP